MTDADILDALKRTPINVLACTVYGEAASESPDGKIAVACVVANRDRRNAVPDVAGVCLKPLQFSCWTPKGGTLNYQRTMDAARSVVTGGKPVHPVDAPCLRECNYLSVGVLSGAIRDITKGATHYFTDSIEPPAWAAKMKFTVHIGHHLFYREFPA